MNTTEQEREELRSEVAARILVIAQQPHQNQEHKWEAVISHIADWISQRDAQREAEYKIDGNTSDGYHTFNELYEFRKAYNALLFNEWATQRKYDVYKSKLHSDGEIPFGGGWFVVGATMPTGQITNHYELKDWDLFVVPEVPRASVWDGHTPQDALKRMLDLASLSPNPGEKQ